MIELLIVVALVGLTTWAITYFSPMPDKFKTAIYAVAGVWALLYVLGYFGLYHGVRPGVDLLLVIAIAGLVAWALGYFIPMPEKFRTAIYVLAGLFVLFYMLQYFGVWHGLPRGLRR